MSSTNEAVKKMNSFQDTQYGDVMEMIYDHRNGDGLKVRYPYPLIPKNVAKLLFAGYDVKVNITKDFDGESIIAWFMAKEGRVGTLVVFTFDEDIRQKYEKDVKEILDNLVIYGLNECKEPATD